jgi:PAS domain S-box-containing protein
MRGPARTGDAFTRKTAIRSIARTLVQPVTYLGVAMLVCIYCAVAYLLVADRKVAEYDAGLRGDNLARVVDQSFVHIFKSVDATLLFLRKSYQQSPSTLDLAAWVHAPSLKNELTFDFMICDANGGIVESSFSKSIIGADRSQEEPFRVHVNSAADELFISKPYILKYNSQWGIALSRRITAADGTFAGVITALLDPSELVKAIGTIDLGPEGSVALVGLDSYLRTRSINGAMDWDNVGRKVALIPQTLGRAFQVRSGHYWSVPGVFNNVRRLVSYRVLESVPLIGLVTISEAEVYRRANENARIYWVIVLLLTSAILIAIGVGARRERKLIEATSEMKQAQETLQRSQERYTLVESAVNDGIFDRNLVTDEIYLSRRWKNILGYADDEIPNVLSSFFDRLHPDDKAALAAAHRAHLKDNKPYALEFRLRCKNGDNKWVHSRGKALRDATNRPIRMLGTITDITERKQAEALIEESRNNLERAETMVLLGTTSSKRDRLRSPGPRASFASRVSRQDPSLPR